MVIRLVNKNTINTGHKVIAIGEQFQECMLHAHTPNVAFEKEQIVLAVVMFLFKQSKMQTQGLF